MLARKCPKCGKDLVLKRKPGRRPFLACPGFPACLHTEVMTHATMLRYMHQPELPMFDEEPAAAAAVVETPGQQ